MTPLLLTRKINAMTQPPDIGQQYDAIAEWWQDYHQDSDYGVAALERALALLLKAGGRWMWDAGQVGGLSAGSKRAVLM